MITVDENRNSNISSEHSEELLNIIENFRLMDDTFMSKVFEDKSCAELLLRVILNRDDLTVVRVVSQFGIKNLQGRSARLDIYAVDDKGKHYDVLRKTGLLVKHHRLRLHHSHPALSVLYSHHKSPCHSFIVSFSQCYI